MKSSSKKRIGSAIAYRPQKDEYACCYLDPNVIHIDVPMIALANKSKFENKALSIEDRDRFIDAIRHLLYSRVFKLETINRLYLVNRLRRLKVIVNQSLAPIRNKDGYSILTTLTIILAR